jgi:hypothetical protein
VVQNSVWAGDTYPRGSFSVSGSPAVNGYILQTDFFKFRGRGLIQTTWRSNYVKLADFALGYCGSDPTVLAYRAKWAGRSADQVCTMSSSEDWDRLFADGGRVILCESIRQHAASRGYFPLTATTTGANGGLGERGSLGFMGLRIGGGKAYAATFKGRMRETCDAFLRAQAA